MMERKPIELLPGSVVGAWKINNLLGRGGQGGVWAVKPVKSKHTPQRALKACFSDDPQARARFLREVEILLRCEHPHILRIYDHDLQWKEHVAGVPPFAYYVSEKCQGSLEERSRELGDVRRRLTLFRQACAAITYLHTSVDQVIHRDLKPANLLIAQEQQHAVLADFGIARSLSSGILTEVFEVVGTPYYRAPEVLHGERGTIQSDVYSVGRVLEWLLTNDVSKDMSTRPVPRGGELDDVVCDILDRILVKATQIIPANRFASVQDMVNQLPDLWLSVRLRPRTNSLGAAADAPTVLATAWEFARRTDLLGWRHLESQLRREYVHRIQIWRMDTEQQWTDQSAQRDGFALSITDTLVDVALARVIFALAGVYSTNSALVDQREVIGDLLLIPDWSNNGKTALIQAPRALVYIFHYLHGALCMSLRQYDLAIQLAEMAAPSQHGSDSTLLLWRQHDLTGWPVLLGEDIFVACNYLSRLRLRWPILERLFALQSDFDVGLASYSMLLSLNELAAYTSDPESKNLRRLESISLDVPPLFLAISATSTTLATAERLIFANRSVVERLAQRATGDAATMRLLWPYWKQLLVKFRGDLFRGHGHFSATRLGDLA